MPRAASSLDVQFDAAEVLELVRDLRTLEGGKPILAALRRNLRAAADPIKRQVQANASWSSRIPAAVAIGTAFTAKRTGVFIKVNSKKAPHARAYEVGSQKSAFGTLRHPVFADPGKDRTEWTWVSEQTRPFFFTETAKYAAEVQQAAGEAVIEAAKTAGYS